jgi:hypothetical protein
LTVDNGKEFATHKSITTELKALVSLLAYLQLEIEFASLPGYFYEYPFDKFNISSFIYFYKLYFHHRYSAKEISC